MREKRHFSAEKHWAQLSKNKEWFIFTIQLFARSLSDKIAFLHTCLSFALVRALAARDANERAKREFSVVVVVGRYAHHKFYFCRETDGPKKNRARKLLNLCDFFFSFFSAIILLPKQTMESFEQCIVYQSQDIFFCFLFSRDFCPLNVVFISICVCVSGGISWMRFTDVNYFFILSFSLSLTFRCFLGY